MGGTYRLLELRYSLLTQRRRGSVLGHWPAFLGSAVARSLGHEFRSPNWRNEKMPVDGDLHKMLLSTIKNVGMHSKNWL